MFGHDDDKPQEQHADQDVEQPSGAPVQPSAQTWQHPGSPLGDDSDAPIAPPSAAPAVTPLTDEGSATSNELIDIKQKALNNLSPLVHQLDQAPEEKFRTLMMMIQASDDQSLIKEAYEAAEAIHDEKTKAQALLDIVNEINYFTQHKA